MWKLRAAALVASEAWRSGRKLLAWCLVLSVVVGEGFGLIMGAERLLLAREERQLMASEVNTGRWIATVRVESQPLPVRTGPRCRIYVVHRRHHSFNLARTRTQAAPCSLLLRHGTI